MGWSQRVNSQVNSRKLTKSLEVASKSSITISSFDLSSTSLHPMLPVKDDISQHNLPGQCIRDMAVPLE